MWPVSEARPRESPGPQDPVRLTPHEAQDKHTKHPAPPGPRRGGPCRRAPPYTSAPPSAAASLAASFPRFCRRPAGGAGAEEKGRRARRKAGHPEPSGAGGRRGEGSSPAGPRGPGAQAHRHLSLRLPQVLPVPTLARVPGECRKHLEEPAPPREHLLFPGRQGGKGEGPAGPTSASPARGRPAPPPPGRAAPAPPAAPPPAAPRAPGAPASAACRDPRSRVTSLKTAASVRRGHSCYARSAAPRVPRCLHARGASSAHCPWRPRGLCARSVGPGCPALPRLAE